ncbi:MAG: hypothetical protein AAF702_40025 [Chloroflexota bacterium]
MSTPILATKLYIPPPRPNLVRRPHLLKQLSEGLQQGAHRKLSLISAPAGFGKTTLVSEWVEQIDNQVAWITLDEEDKDPTRFFCLPSGSVTNSRREHWPKRSEFASIPTALTDRVAADNSTQ